MYKRIGQAARQRAAAARNQIEALQPDVEKARPSSPTSTERSRQRRSSGSATCANASPPSHRDRGADRVGRRAHDESWRSWTRQLGLLADLHMPDDVIDLDRRLAEATDPL